MPVHIRTHHLVVIIQTLVLHLASDLKPFHAVSHAPSSELLASSSPPDTWRSVANKAHLDSKQVLLGKLNVTLEPPHFAWPLGVYAIGSGRQAPPLLIKLATDLRDQVAIQFQAADGSSQDLQVMN